MFFLVFLHFISISLVAHNFYNNIHSDKSLAADSVTSTAYLSGKSGSAGGKWLVFFFCMMVVILGNKKAGLS